MIYYNRTICHFPFDKDSKISVGQKKITEFQMTFNRKAPIWSQVVYFLFISSLQQPVCPVLDNLNPIYSGLFPRLYLALLFC